MLIRSANEFKKFFFIHCFKIICGIQYADSILQDIFTFA